VKHNPLMSVILLAPLVKSVSVEKRIVNVFICVVMKVALMKKSADMIAMLTLAAVQKEPSALTMLTVCMGSV